MIKKGLSRSHASSESLSVSQREADAVEQNPEVFARLGFSVERAAAESIVVREIPALLRGSQVEASLRDVISDVLGVVALQIGSGIKSMKYRQLWLVTVQELKRN